MEPISAADAYKFSEKIRLWKKQVKKGLVKCYHCYQRFDWHHITADHFYSKWTIKRWQEGGRLLLV